VTVLQPTVELLQTDYKFYIITYIQ